MEGAITNPVAVGDAIDIELPPNLAEAFLKTVDSVGDAVAIRTNDDSTSWTWEDV